MKSLTETFIESVVEMAKPLYLTIRIMYLYDLKGKLPLLEKTYKKHCNYVIDRNVINHNIKTTLKELEELK